MSLFVPFVCSFYAHELPSMFFNHHFGLGGKLFIILLFMGTCQGDPLTRPLFILVHSCALQASFVAFLLCFFLSLANDTHIFGPTSFVPFSFDHFASQLTLMGLIVQPCKCTIWSPSTLPPNFSLPFGFCYSFYNIEVLGVPFGFVSFSFSFLKDVLDENVHHANVFLRLGDESRCFA